MGSLEWVDGSQMRGRGGPHNPGLLVGPWGSPGHREARHGWSGNRARRTEGKDTLEMHCEKTASQSPGESEGRGN